jgi:hypothetical protein
VNDVEVICPEQALSGRIDMGLCAEHRVQLEAGAPYEMDRDDGGRAYLVMSADLAGKREWLIGDRAPRLSYRASVLSSDPRHELHVFLEVHRRGSEDADELDVLLTREYAEELRDELTWVLDRWKGDEPARRN